MEYYETAPSAFQIFTASILKNNKINNAVSNKIGGQRRTN